MSERQVKTIFDEKIIEKYKKKIANGKKMKSMLLPILVTLLFTGAVVSITLIKTKFAYMFSNEQKVFYVKDNTIYMRNIDGTEIVAIDNNFLSDPNNTKVTGFTSTSLVAGDNQADDTKTNTNAKTSNNVPASNKKVSKASKGSAVYNKINKEFLYLKDIYSSGGVSVGTLKLKNLGSEESDTIENDVIARSIYFNSNDSYCIFEKLTSNKAYVNLFKYSFKDKNRLSNIADNVKVDSYYIIKDTGNIVYMDSANRLFVYDGTNNKKIDDDVYNMDAVYYSYDDESMRDKVYYTKQNIGEKQNSYTLYEYNIVNENWKTLVNDMSGYASVLPDGSYYYTKDEFFEFPYSEYIDVNSTDKDIRPPSAMTRETLEGIEFVVYKNNIYDASDTEKVAEVIAKHDIEFSDYQLKIERYHEFLTDITTKNYQMVFRSLYYFDGHNEYKLNEGNVSRVDFFDGGVFFKIDKEFPLVKSKLSDVINSGARTLDEAVDNLIKSKKGFYYVYKGLDGMTDPALNFLKNEEVRFVNADGDGNINVTYSHYIVDKLYYNVLHISSDLKSITNEETDKFLAVTTYPYSSHKKSELARDYDNRNSLYTKIGDDDAKSVVEVDAKQLNIIISNNETLQDEELIAYLTNFDANSGSLYIYNNKRGKSVKVSDNVEAGIVIANNQAISLTKSQNGKSDLRYGRNIIEEDVSCIIDVCGNNQIERQVKHIDPKAKKNKKNETIDESPKIVNVATRSYLLAGRDYSEAETIATELAYVQFVGFETIDGIKMYNKGNFDYARNEWVDIGAFRYHFDAKGEMEVSKWIDDLYYVNHVGVMVTNTRTPDGYRVDANGEFIDDAELKRQAERLAASTTKKALENKKNNLSSSSSGKSGSSSGSSTNVGGSTAQTNKNKSGGVSTTATELESPNRKFYVSGYQKIEQYYLGDNDNCDIVINYPIISGEDAAEVARINEEIENWSEYLLTEAQEDIDLESVTPSMYVINKAKVGNITNSKVTINLTGTMVRPAGNKSVKIVMTYHRDDGSMDVS